MRNRFIFTGIAILLIITGGIYFQLAQKSPLSSDPPAGIQDHKPDDLPGNSDQAPVQRLILPPPSSLMPASGQETPVPEPRTFIVTADDYSLSLSEITVKKNTPVTIIFRTKKINVSGYLIFKGADLTTNPIGPEQSGFLTFTAGESFEIAAFLKSGVKTGYSLKVTVR